jgi:hypothetical protein
MLEAAVWPADLTQWGSRAYPFYLEVGGETSPIVDQTSTHHRRGEGRDPDGDGNASPRDHSEGDHEGGHRDHDRLENPVYEYSWTLGHPGAGAEADPWWHRFHAPQRDEWDDMDDPAARVYLYFPTQGGWRADELATSLTYLSPVHHQEDLHDKAADDWAKVQPILNGAGDLAGKLTAVPGLGPVAGAVAPGIAAAAKLSLTKVPPGTYKWTVAKVAAHMDGEFFQGVMWTLPKAVFSDLGGRLTGTLAVTIQASSYQQGDRVATVPALRPVAVRAKAVIHHGGKWTDVPGEGGFVRLIIEPRLRGNLW